jgi:hypothetical protein
MRFAGLWFGLSGRVEKSDFLQKSNFWAEVTSITKHLFSLFPLLPYSLTPLPPTAHSLLPQNPDQPLNFLPSGSTTQNLLGDRQSLWQTAGDFTHLKG